MRLKALSSTVAVAAALLGVAGPAAAKQEGKERRCVAAQNGKHNGFSCQRDGGTIHGRCPGGYEAVALIYPDADLNANGVVCQNGDGLATDDIVR